MDPWQSVLLALGGNAALLAVLGWLAKSLIEKFLTKDIERFKATLASESQIAAERLKHELQLTAAEHQIRFSKLHEKRASVVADLYGLLVQASWDGQSFASIAEFSGEPSKQEKFTTAMNSLAEFFRFFDKHRIYLPEALCGQLEAFVQAMREKVISFGVYLRYDKEPLPAHAAISKDTAWSEAWSYFTKQVPLARSALEQELRRIIGAA